jgi:hypothetical protein
LNYLYFAPQRKKNALITMLSRHFFCILRHENTICIQISTNSVRGKKWGIFFFVRSLFAVNLITELSKKQAHTPEGSKNAQIRILSVFDINTLKMH